MTLVQTPRNRSPTLKSAHPKKQMEVLIEQCLPEYRHQVLSQQEKQLRLNNFARLVASGVLLSFVLIKPFNSFAEWGWRALNLPTFDKSSLETNLKIDSTNADFNAPLKFGEKVLQWEVTSVFGKREKPCATCSSDHLGVDINTPEGTPVYAIADNIVNGTVYADYVDVDCPLYFGNPNEGRSARVTSPIFPEYVFVYYHLSECNTGRQPYGSVIAKTGNTGSSTAPHLHFQVEYKGQPIDPPRGFVLWTLQGKKPETRNKPIVERLRNAIAGQESNHNPKAVNPHSNALGLAQVMPENVQPWTKQCKGIDVTEEQFLKDAKLQTEVVNCKLEEYLEITAKTAQNQDEQIRKVASMWYSGQPQLYDDPKPQKYGAGDYPSIREYTTTVLERFKKQ